MRIGIIVSKGFEKVAVMQIEEFLDIKSVHVSDTVVFFEAKNLEDVYRFVYLSQIASRILYVISDFDYADDNDFLDKMSSAINPKDEMLDLLISKNVDFRSSLDTDEETDVTYLESEIGGILINKAKKSGNEIKVNLKNPTLNLYTHVHNKSAVVGIDLSGDLSKRDYKLFNNAVSLKGPTAFGLLMLAGYEPSDSYVNPCCYSGTIEIEAALYCKGMSHRFYNKNFPFMKISDFAYDTDSSYWESFFRKIDSKISKKNFDITGSDKLLSSITAASKNAKIAGIIDTINFRRIDLDWMDIKYAEESVDKIISFIPGSSKHADLSKEYKQLFYQAEYILKDSGVMVVMCLSKDLLIAQSAEFMDLEKESIVHSGAQQMHVLHFRKSL